MCSSGQFVEVQILSIPYLIFISALYYFDFYSHSYFSFFLFLLSFYSHSFSFYIHSSTLYYHFYSHLHNKFHLFLYFPFIPIHIFFQVEDGSCSAYMGPIGSGNYVKMVHNGIEYGKITIKINNNLK